MSIWSIFLRRCCINGHPAELGRCCIFLRTQTLNAVCLCSWTTQVRISGRQNRNLLQNERGITSSQTSRLCDKMPHRPVPMKGDFQQLFVSKRFDWIKPRRLHGGPHSKNQAY